ncbi:MAG TPA: stress protein, partial [Spongiibacteraceae bacterium]|nr:stress protein [Spongiibacteraceae bacterium]
RVSGIVNSSFGADLSIFPGNADYMLVLDFENEDDFKNYVMHPAHAELMESVTGPLMESWSTAQIAL